MSRIPGLLGGVAPPDGGRSLAPSERGGAFETLLQTPSARAAATSGTATTASGAATTSEHRPSPSTAPAEPAAASHPAAPPSDGDESNEPAGAVEAELDGHDEPAEQPAPWPTTSPAVVVVADEELEVESEPPRDEVTISAAAEFAVEAVEAVETGEAVETVETVETPVVVEASVAAADGDGVESPPLSSAETATKPAAQPPTSESPTMAESTDDAPESPAAVKEGAEPAAPRSAVGDETLSPDESSAPPAALPAAASRRRPVAASSAAAAPEDGGPVGEPSTEVAKNVRRGDRNVAHGRATSASAGGTPALAESPAAPSNNVAPASVAPASEAAVRPSSLQPAPPPTPGPAAASTGVAATTNPPRFEPPLVTRPAAPATAAPELSAADQARLAQRVARAIERAGSDDALVRLRLSPPELGSLKVEVQLREGALWARLEVETTAARALLLENLPTLRERLAEQSIRVEQFDVDLTDRHGGGAAGSGRGDDHSAERRGASRPPPTSVAPGGDTTTKATEPLARGGFDDERLNVII